MLKWFDANKLFCTQIVFSLFFFACVVYLHGIFNFGCIGAIYEFTCICMKMHCTECAHAYCYSLIRFIRSDNERYGMHGIHKYIIAILYVWFQLAMVVSVSWWCCIDYTSASEVSEPKLHEHERIELRFVFFFFFVSIYCVVRSPFVYMWSLYTDRVKRMFNILYSLHLYTFVHIHTSTHRQIHAHAFAHSILQTLYFSM